LFVPSASELLAQLHRSVRSGEDPETIRKWAHSLKGSAATASATALADCAADLERVAGSPQALSALNALDSMFSRTAAEWRRLGWTAPRDSDLASKADRSDAHIRRRPSGL
jgi:HPt (histidine-containing phosphotransfer) domain-containing protein